MVTLSREEVMEALSYCYRMEKAVAIKFKGQYPGGSPYESEDVYIVLRYDEFEVDLKSVTKDFPTIVGRVDHIVEITPLYFT